MKGVNNKLANVAIEGLKKPSRNRGKGKRQNKVITARELASVNHRLDQCLPMETIEWLRVEQLLMQVLEFAPTSLVYEAGMAIAVYADDQARRAYFLGADDAAQKCSSEDAA